MIYDCFTFFNELDLLEIRLNYLNDIVDKFVLVEMGRTHSNEDKPFFFEENKKRYKKFLPKIIHIKVTDYPKPEDHTNRTFSWVLENFQRDCIMRGLADAKNDDIIMISDLDEIPSIDAIKSYHSGILVCVQKMMYYYLNNLNTSDPFWYSGTRILHFSDMNNPSIPDTHHFGAEFTRKELPTNIRFTPGKNFMNGGWHFSYLGGDEAISYKIKSFAHQELNFEEFTNTEKIKERVQAGLDIFNRGYVYSAIPIDDSFPEYIIKHKRKYKHLILPC